MVQLTSELKNLRLSLVNIQPCLVSAFQLLLSGHSTLVRESISIAAVESASTSVWIALSTRPAGSPLMQKITQVQDCEQLTVRCIHSRSAGACTELASPAVPASFVDLQSIEIFGSHFDFLLGAFHSLNTRFVTFASASSGSFHLRSLLFWMSVFVPAPSSAVISDSSKLS